jgi:hypothetical protein
MNKVRAMKFLMKCGYTGDEDKLLNLVKDYNCFKLTIKLVKGWYR